MITSGSIKKRVNKKGHSWQITIEMPKDPITGKRVRKYRTVYGTKKEAEREMHKFIDELEKGIEKLTEELLKLRASIRYDALGFIITNETEDEEQ